MFYKHGGLRTWYNPVLGVKEELDNYSDEDDMVFDWPDVKMIYSGNSDDKSSSIAMKKWTYIDYVRAHTHDVRYLTLAISISREEPFQDEKVKRIRNKEKPVEFSYHKWAHMRVQTVLRKKHQLVGLTTIF